MPEIRILLADDHNVLRQGIAQVLESQADMRVIAQAADGLQAVALAREKRPDVALLDINMPELDGVEATRRIKEALPETGIIILTMYRLDNFIFDAIKAGASGYLLKEVEMQDLIASVRRVAQGEAVLDPAIAGKVLAEFRPQGRGRRKSPPVDLARRDIQILNLVSQGLSNQEISAQLSISEKTVRNRLSLVFKQLHLKNRTEAALFALRSGLGDDESDKTGTNVPGETENRD